MLVHMIYIETDGEVVIDQIAVAPKSVPNPL
jgi:hypothetical protein